MKYNQKLYAKALAEVVHERMSIRVKEKVVQRFIATVRHHGDLSHIKKIIEEAERMICKKIERRRVRIETARPLPNLNRTLHSFLKQNDVVSTDVLPALVAGIRITVDDHRQFDMTLRRKIDKLFSA